jgi:flagellar motor switch protein FliM
MRPASAAMQTTPARKYELGQPIIRREQRIAFERIHHAFAQAWSEAAVGDLPDDAALEFDGLDFGTIASVAIDPSSCAQISLFTVAPASVSGFLMMTGAFARWTVAHRLGLKSPSQKSAPEAKLEVPFTRIEAAVAREITRSMLARLGEAYRAANLGNLGSLRPCDNTADSFGLAPEEPLALLTFHLGTGNGRRVLIGLSGSILNSLTEHLPETPADSNGRDAVASVVRRLPIEVDVVLGSWKVPLHELLELRAGDRIVLPDGEDASLSASGVRVRRARVELRGSRANIAIERTAR